VSANLGVNPSLTITAQAERAMAYGRTAASRTNEPRWESRTVESPDRALQSRRPANAPGALRLGWHRPARETRVCLLSERGAVFPCPVESSRAKRAGDKVESVAIQTCRSLSHGSTAEVSRAGSASDTRHEWRGREWSGDNSPPYQEPTSRGTSQQKSEVRSA